MTKALATAVCLVALSAAGAFAKSPVAIVAAENFYGDIARQIGGPDVEVTSILSNPDQDPHLFEASPSVARDISGARIVIYSGIDYDPWIEKLLNASPSGGRKEIAVAGLVGRMTGDNPHIWYDPATMLVLARTLTDALGTEDPANRGGYEKRLADFETSIKAVDERIATLKRRLAGTAVTATEPVFGYMFEQLGMEVRNQPFQLDVMNDTEPSPSDIAAFENDLKTHKVRLLVYNSQASDPIADRLAELARDSNIPVVGATETEPAGKTYQEWMASELDAVDKALPSPTQ